jgi:polyhydroxyalkanoate synthesis repressor PhaR
MSTPDQATSASSDANPVVVKKYANRRLYNTETSSYITLETLAEMVRGGRDFVVYDAKTGEDITRSVLTQIIVEEEAKGGGSMLPIPFLRQLIGFYGDSLQGLVPSFLEQAMGSFAQQQKQMRATLQQSVTPFLPPGLEEVGRQNIAMMERAMGLFAPFYKAQVEAAGNEAAGKEGASETVQLRAEVEKLRTELAEKTKTKRGAAE